MNLISNFIYNFDLHDFILYAVAILISITIHEYSHGYVAYLLGDNTAKSQGRLTLNPIDHIDPFGLLMLVVFHFGWAKPVPVNMGYFKNPKKGMAITALAGPVSNMLVAYICLTIYAGTFPFDNVIMETIRDLLFAIASISVGLGIFNLIPISPLDGSKILYSFLPNETYYKMLSYERYGFIVLILLINFDPVMNLLSMAIGAAFQGIWMVASFPFELLYNVIL